MLENTLDEAPPEAPAPEVDEARVVEKARLRQAEALLLAEERAAYERSDPGATSPEYAEAAAGASPAEGGLSQAWGATRPVVSAGWAGREGELLSWYDQATAQLAMLKEANLVSRTLSKSTGRMAIPRREKLQPMDHPTMVPPPALAVPEPRRLTDLLSTSPAALRASKPKLRSVTAEMYAPKRGFDAPPVQRKVPGPKSRYMEPRKAWSEEDIAKASSKPSAARRPLPHSPGKSWAMEPSVDGPLSSSELDELFATEPSEAVAVVGAAVLILITPGNTVPADVRWTALASQPRGPFLVALSEVDAEAVPKFKLRALKRFLSVDSFNPVALAEAGAQAAAKLAVWVLRVIAAHPEGGAIITEVQGALEAWDEAVRAVGAQPKKNKKLRRKKAAAAQVAVEPVERLVADVGAAGSACKPCLPELRAAARGGGLSVGTSKVLEAMSLLLERKSSVDAARALLSKAAAKGEATLEVRLRDFGVIEASALGKRACRLLAECSEDAILEDAPLRKASLAAATVMAWVRAATALVLFIEEENRVKALEAAEADRAAAKLQGLQRQKLAKQKVAEVREQKKAEVEQNSAATLLQGKQRQRQAIQRAEQRKLEREVVAQNQAATKLQGLERRKNAKRVAGAKRVERDEAAARAMAEAAERERAATKLQSIGRGMAAKKRVEGVQRAKDLKKSTPLEYDTDEASRTEPKKIFALSRPAEEDDGDDEYDDDDGDDDNAEDQAASSGTPLVQPTAEQVAPKAAAGTEYGEQNAEDDEYGDDEYADEGFSSPPKLTLSESERPQLMSAGSEGYGEDEFDEEYGEDDPDDEDASK